MCRLDDAFDYSSTKNKYFEARIQVGGVKDECKKYLVNCGEKRTFFVSNLSLSTQQRHGFMYLSKIIMILVVFLFQFEQVHGRRKKRQNWKVEEIVVDPKKQSLLQERDIFLVSTEPSTLPSPEPSIVPSSSPTKEASLSPSYQPSSTPSKFPTLQPSVNPTLIPSMKPTLSPSFLPSNIPSSLPTSTPSKVPSSLPTTVPSTYPTQYLSNMPSISPLTLSPSLFYPIGQMPDFDDPQSRSYFNYNPYDIHYGPGNATLKMNSYNESKESSEIVQTESKNMTKKNTTVTKSYEYIDYEGNTWSSVRNSKEYDYWKEFDMNRTLGNRCNSNPWRRQSPIDLCETHVNTGCLEHHQIRNRGGEINLDDAEIELQILPSKLRIKYSRENSQLKEDNGLIPPHSDFPLNWNGYISAVHIDIKIPSEHTFCGKRYAGEYQIFFYHPKRKQPIVQSVLIEIHPRNRTHIHFQKVLNEWQAIFDLKQMECEYNQRRRNRDRTRTLKRENDQDLSTSFLGDELHNSSYEEDKKKDDAYYNSLLKMAKERANNPIFDEEYQGVSAAPSEMAFISSLEPISTVEPNLNSSTCMEDVNNTFVLDNANKSCCDLLHPNLIWSCNQSRVYESCFAICSNLTYTMNETQMTPSQSPSPSSSSAPSKKQRPRWNPFWPRIINSIHFYGYGGSLTEPPCSEWVAWRVLDTPMQISYNQWDQMRNILLNQVDGPSCRRTSVHWEGSVARPTQSLNGRPLWKCTESDYLSDVEKRAARASKEGVRS